MAKIVVTDAFVSLGGTDISDSVASLSFEVNIDTQDSTTMGTNGWRDRLGGLKDFTVSIDALTDFAASELDSVVWPLAIAAVPVALIIRPTSAVVGTSNPQFAGNVIITQYTPLSGGVGSLAGGSFSLEGAGQMVRTTSA